MAVTVAASSSGRAIGATTLTVSHTVPSGTDRYMVVLCNISSAATITATTYGGVALTKTDDVTAANNSGRLVVFVLANPTVGTANFVLTVSSSSSLTACVLTLTDCISLTALETAEGSSTTPSITVVSAATDALVLDIVGNALNNSTFTVGAGQTSIVEQESIADTNRKLSVSREAGAASVTMSWTTSVSGVWISGALTALSSTSLSTGRITQDAIEVLSQPVASARMGQYAVEVLSATTPVPGIMTQYVVELLSLNPTVTPISSETTQFFIIS